MVCLPAGVGGGSSGDDGGFILPPTTTDEGGARQGTQKAQGRRRQAARGLRRPRTREDLQGGALTISCGRTSVRAELGENPEIKVDTADLSAVSKGDKIAGTLDTKCLTKPERLTAEKVTITAAKIISGGASTKKSARREEVDRSGQGHKAERPTRRQDRSGQGAGS